MLAVPWFMTLIAGVFTMEAWFISHASAMQFLVHKVALGHVFLPVLQFFPVVNQMQC
jgi:hypothetical protein